MPLNKYQKTILSNTRLKERIYGLKFWSLTTGAGYSALDAYRKQSWTETSTLFSGAVHTNPYSQKRDDSGGFFKTSDIIIVASRDNRNIAGKKDVKVEYDSNKYRVNSVIDCPDSQEIVIRASQLE